MPTDLNDIDALIENLVDAFREAVIKGAHVRVDANGEMTVSHDGVERAHVSATGVVAEIDGEKIASKSPLPTLLRHPNESQAETQRRVLGENGGT